MVIVNWKLRPKGDRVSPYVKYNNDLNLFTLKVNHVDVFTYVYGPKRTRAPRRVYKGGNADWFDDVDVDGFSVLEVSSMVKELGFGNPQTKFYYKKPTADLDKGLEPLSKYIDVLDMLNYVNKYKLMEVFIEHPIDNSVMDTIYLEQEDASAGLGDENVGNVANDLQDENVKEFDPLFSYPHMQIDNNEGSDHNRGSNNNKRSDHNEGSDNNEGSDHNEGSDNNEVSDDNDESDDSDFECDIEDRIDDVHIDMQMCKDNIDSNVEWVSSTEPEPQTENNENLVYEEVDLEDFDSEIDSDDDEAERRNALRKEESSWYCRVFKDTHTCLQSRTVRKCTSSFLSKEIEETIKPNPKIPLSALKEQLQKYEIGVSKQKVFRAKQMAEHKVHGDHITQYTQLRQYVLELKEKNPDITVKIDVERDYEPDSITRQFRRIYVCLGALKSRFKAGQRDILGLDGCFMSGPFPMQILIAIGVDPNYGIYHLAYAIVESENKQAWLWFLDCLRDDLKLFRNSNFTFVTDRQKGLIPALAETFPAAKHRNIEELKARPHCDVLLNNMCEVLNRQLKDERDKPIITCLEFIKEYLMKRIVIVQQVISKSNGPLTPKATKVFEVIKKLAAQYTISWNGGNLYQAVGPKSDQCVVNVEERACSCRKWDLTCMPCKRTVRAIWNMAENGLEPGIPESWVHPSYWLATWDEMHRPLKKRKKSAAKFFDGLVKNGKLSRFGQTVTCCKCGKKGHNSITCKGQRGATSAPAVNQTQTTQTTVNPSTPAVNISQTTQTTVNSPYQTSSTMRYTKQKASRYSPAENTNASGSGKRKDGE
nr:hypothetical protein [Tanacetum cinerariifolium]